MQSICIYISRALIVINYFSFSVIQKGGLWSRWLVPASPVPSQVGFRNSSRTRTGPSLHGVATHVLIEWIFTKISFCENTHQHFAISFAVVMETLWFVCC